MDKLSSETAKGEGSPTTVCRLKADLQRSKVSESATVSPAARLITHATPFQYQQLFWLVDRRIVSSVGPLKDVLILVACGDEPTSLPRRAVQVDELEAWIASGLVDLENVGSALQHNLSAGWNGPGHKAALQPEDGA